MVDAFVAAFPAHFTVTLMVPSPADFAKNHQFTPPDTFSPNSKLTSSGASRARNDPATCSARLRDPLQPLGQPAALAHVRLPATKRHQVALSGLEHHIRAVIEREPHKLGHQHPQGQPWLPTNRHTHPPALPADLHR